MTEKTFTAYQDDSLQNKYATYLIEESTFIRIKNKKSCFKLKNNIQEDLFCNLKFENNFNFVEEWDYDFNLFKNQCFKPRVQSTESLSEKTKLAKQFEQKVEMVKLDIIKEKEIKIREKSNLQEQKLISKKIDSTRLISLNAMAKEMKLEDLIEKEEMNKEKDENEKLQLVMLNEEKKKSMLIKAIKEKEIETQYNIAKTHAEEAINNITIETKKNILAQRRNIARKITEMRIKQKRKQSEIQGNIMTIRYQIAKKLQTSNHVGNADLCLKFEEKDKYCTANFADNFVKFKDCKSEESFCYVCCENEFGELHLIERDNCYTKCDKARITKNYR
jgi:hypothetical protein